MNFSRGDSPFKKPESGGGTNQYGDPEGTAYAGGNPFFDMKSGGYKPYTGKDGVTRTREEVNSPQPGPRKPPKSGFDGGANISIDPSTPGFGREISYGGDGGDVLRKAGDVFKAGFDKGQAPTKAFNDMYGGGIHQGGAPNKKDDRQRFRKRMQETRLQQREQRQMARKGGATREQLKQQRQKQRMERQNMRQNRKKASTTDYSQPYFPGGTAADGYGRYR